MLLSILIGVIVSAGLSFGVIGILATDTEYNITRLHQGCHFAARYEQGTLRIGHAALCLHGNPHPKER